MGQCNYYLKAEFLTKAAVNKAMAEIRLLLEESHKAYAYWQDNRNQTEFWAGFSTQFPTMTEYLKDVGKYGGGCNNELSGIMDFGTSDSELYNLSDEGYVIGYIGTDVWHLGTWEHFASFIQKKFGATKVIWNTEENGIASLDGLNLYEWQDIVKAIIKEKAILPTLLGIHDDLDVLIEQRLKKTKG